MGGNLDQKFRDTARHAVEYANARDRHPADSPMPITANRKWHVVQVAAKFERLIENDISYVSKQIKAAGFEVYSPRLRRLVMPKSSQLSRAQRQHRAALGKEKIEPLFPRYEFVRFDPVSDRWHDIFKIVGVFGMLCANNLPKAMPDEFIAGLRSREVGGAIPGETIAVQVFSVGERVRISMSGAMKGLTGPIERLDDAGRIRLLLSIFGGAAVDLTIADIEKL